MTQRPTSLSFALTFSLAGFAAAQQTIVPAAPATRVQLVPLPGRAATASGTTTASPTTAAQPAAATMLVEGAQQEAAPAAAQDPAKQAAAAAAQQKAQAANEQQQRIQQIRAVKFDRRGTTMLRTWATPKGEEVTQPVTEAQPMENEAPTDGEPPNASEDVVVTQTVQSATIITSLAPLPTTAATPTLTVAATPNAPAESAAAAPGTSQASAEAAPAALPVEAQPTTRKPDAFAQSLKDWSRAVTLGNWAAVKTFLAGLASPEEKKAAWQHMLQSLRVPPQDSRPQAPNQPPATHRFGFDDVLGLIAAKPIPLDDAALAALGAILQSAVQRGNLTEPLLSALVREVQKPETERALGQRDAVKLLLAANLAAEAAEFLPKLEDAVAGNDSEGLNLLAKSLVARNTKDGKATFLEQAWAALQANFAAKTLDKKQKDEALRLAVMLAPRIKQELGKAWLDQSFTRDVQRGMDILASIGAAAAEVAATNANDSEFRKQTLLLQNTAVAALLAAAPERAKDWSLQLGILADNWLREAQQSYQLDQSASYFPQARRDRFGNFFYVDDSMSGGNNGRPTPAIKAADILDLRPTAAWLGCVEDGLKPKFAMLIAQLWLKVQEEAQAFPYIAELAKTHPKQANDLVNEFLRVWTRNHDPNAERRNYYFYGYEQRADGIPLTRSKQQRNLEELSKWVTQLRTLPIGAIDESLLAKAFTTCHSSAEVYKLDAIQTVFGSLQDLKPATLAALVEQMRGNLATVWRLPATQEQQKTKRKQKDIEQEVLRGYQVAIEVVEDGLQRHTGSWGLLLARAALRHDENDFRRELGNDTKFTQRRGDAFADFAAAAAAYQKQLPELLREQENVSAYEHWFYAALGSSELANVNHEQVVDQRQVEAVRDALKALPGDAGERHLAMFASGLFTKMSALKPAVKFRYLKAGLAVIGDHKQGAEAKKLFDYYQDLVTEIRLETRVDGATAVAPDQPFGLFVDLRHTREIEREAGGFGRYLRNQNDVAYSFNYGRPTENYRDKFQEMCKAQLSENFDVLSVTFQTENVHSVATEQYGWRVTPYAYVMLKPKGPQIDRVPSLRLDLDFLDTSGYVVLPIESPALPIDASRADAPARPVADVELTQILDERQSKDGKLKLEIKATGHGLMPALAQLADLAPAGFAIAETEDSGPMVSRFDQENQTAILSERTWNLTLLAKDGAELPRTFAFAKPKLEKTKLVFQRYADADLVTAAAEVELVGNYSKASPLRTWGLIGGAAALLAIGLVLFRRGPTATTAVTGLQVPDKLTPFTVIGLLREIEALPGTSGATKTELQAAIAQIEAGYFSAAQSSPADLHTLATTWVARANRAS